jgi:hypothetical protein
MRHLWLISRSIEQNQFRFVSTIATNLEESWGKQNHQPYLNK